ncbi:helix-turn-helix domain-containing protein [Azospirillum sp. INR13]|uniref:helix-turn-helix domain-containing protein n=1 Tax=Azospirillum sp. INR13 TaxID=2596919 RepID=UPI00351C42F5
MVYLRRPGGQSQFSALLDLEPRSDRVRRALVHAKENLKNELSVEELAEVANLSPRQFSRLFRQETGQTPAKAVEHLRLEAARVMMEEGRHSMDVIAPRNRLRRPRAHAPRLPARLRPAAAGGSPRCGEQSHFGAGVSGVRTCAEAANT